MSSLLVFCHSISSRVASDRSKSLLFAILIVSTFVCSSSVYGEPFTESQKRFTAYRERAFQLQNNNNSKYLTGELNTLNQWIKQAERFLREEEEDEFIKVVRLVQVQLRLVDLSLEELDAREQILKLYDEAKRLETKAKNERESVVELEKMMGGSLNSRPSKSSMVPPNTETSSPSMRPQNTQGDGR